VCVCVCVYMRQALFSSSPSSPLHPSPLPPSPAQPAAPLNDQEEERRRGEEGCSLSFAACLQETDCILQHLPGWPRCAVWGGVNILRAHGRRPRRGNAMHQSITQIHIKSGGWGRGGKSENPPWLEIRREREAVADARAYAFFLSPSSSLSRLTLSGGVT